MKSVYPLFLLITSFIIINATVPVVGCSLRPPPVGQEYYFNTTLSLVTLDGQILDSIERKGGLGADCRVSVQYDIVGDQLVIGNPENGEWFNMTDDGFVETSLPQLEIWDDYGSIQWNNIKWNYYSMTQDYAIYYQSSFESLLYRDLSNNSLIQLDLGLNDTLPQLANTTTFNHFGEVVDTNVDYSSFDIFTFNGDLSRFFMIFVIQAEGRDWTQVRLLDYQLNTHNWTSYPIELDHEQVFHSMVSSYDGSSLLFLETYDQNLVLVNTDTRNSTNLSINLTDHGYIYDFVHTAAIRDSMIYLQYNQSLWQYPINGDTAINMQVPADTFILGETYFIVSNGKIQTIRSGILPISWMFVVAIPIIAIIRRYKYVS